MTGDAELDVFRQAVNCAAVLERMAGGWKLDVRESTKKASNTAAAPAKSSS